MVQNEALKQLFIKIHKMNPDKISMIHLRTDISDISINAFSLEYQKIIKKTYLDYYYHREGGSFHIKLYNPFQI